MKEIKGLLDSRQTLIKEYIKMKAILVSQGSLPMQGIKAFSPRSAPTSVVKEPIVEEVKSQTLVEGLQKLKGQKTEQKPDDKK